MQAPSPEVVEYLKGCIGCIEATSCEQHYVWERNKRGAGLPWHDSGSGYGPVIGYIGDRPVAISILTTLIDGNKFLFYYGMSEIVDHKMIREWLQKYMPTSAFEDNDPRKRLNHTDAANWANVLPHKEQEAA